MVLLPDLTGQTLAAASDYLTADNLQLKPVPVPDASCPTAPGSPITQQSLAPGDVPQHSEVQLTYCAGLRRAAYAVGRTSGVQALGTLARLGQSGDGEPVAEHAVSALGQHRLGVELHAVDRRRHVLAGP